DVVTPAEAARHRRGENHHPEPLGPAEEGPRKSRIRGARSLRRRRPGQQRRGQGQGCRAENHDLQEGPLQAVRAENENLARLLQRGGAALRHHALHTQGAGGREEGAHGGGGVRQARAAAALQRPLREG
ncbi:hypothetical protein HGM15179_021576, partial [Zosterops borbonicus]